jgi:hypothetical protein
LPHTGGDILLPGLAGLMLLGLGGVFVTVWYRRRGEQV